MKNMMTDEIYLVIVIYLYMLKHTNFALKKVHLLSNVHEQYD